MNKVEKFLKKINEKERDRLDPVIERILSNDFSHLDIKKIKGRDSVFRARVGRIRIIFKSTETGYEIIDLTNRDDNTYN
jgi:mRNA-degrading endonuclease RelE of RelBE toxin-antitoxin system